MLDRKKHHIHLVNLLKTIYSDSSISSSLGFKGGTAAYLFYDLPRFSVDLDFDLLVQDSPKQTFERIGKILAQEGVLKDSIEKHYTLFFLLQTDATNQNIKVEISKRSTMAHYRVMHYLGIPMKVMEKPDMVASKLVAFLMRKKFAARDMYDLWFFLKKGWDIRGEIVQEQYGQTTVQALENAIKKTRVISGTQLLQGLGELLDEEQKKWVRQNLREELLFQLKLYSEHL